MEIGRLTWLEQTAGGLLRSKAISPEFSLQPPAQSSPKGPGTSSIRKPISKAPGFLPRWEPGYVNTQKAPKKLTAEVHPVLAPFRAEVHEHFPQPTG